MLLADDLPSALLLAGLMAVTLAAGIAIGRALSRRPRPAAIAGGCPPRSVAPDIAVTILRELLRNASGPIAVKDLKGRFVLVNHKFSEIHGRRPEDLAGTEIASLYPPEKLAFFEEQDRRMLAIGATTQNEVRAVQPDGTVLDLLTTRFPIRDEHGEVFAVGTLNTDIGAQKKIEADLRAHRDNLEAAVAERTDELRRLNANKDRLFSIVAHDLRGPFNSILGFSAMLAENVRGLDPEKTAHYARHIHDSSRSLFDLLNNLLDWSRLQMNELRLDARPHMAAGLVAEAVEQCRPSAADKGIAIHTRLADQLTVVADRTALITVLRNVIGNAVKFSEPGSTVEVRAMGTGQRGVVEVHDTGIGMTAETLSSLFDPAYQNTRPGTRGEGGSGLGLQICRELMERQAGTLAIDSASGRGTIVRLSLPIQNAPIQNAPVQEARPA